MFFAAIACGEKNPKRLREAPEVTQKKTSYILYPRRCLLSGLALIFFGGGKLSLTQLVIKTFLSPGRAGGHILPVKLLVSLATS